MNNKVTLLKELEKDIIFLENKINNRKLYNFRNSIIGFFIKSGIFLDKAMPFILSSVILFYGGKSKGKTPFINDKVKEKATIISIITSNNNAIPNKIEYISYPYSKSIEYSTGWKLNDKGLYERTVTTYEPNAFNDVLSVEEILNMTHDEIKDLFFILDVSTIEKKSLTEEDKVYNEDLIMVKTYQTTENHYRYRNESFKENMIDTSLCLLLVYILGSSFKNIKRIIFKDYLINKLNMIELNYRIIKKTEIEEVLKIINLKKEDLAFLNNENVKENSRKIKQRRRFHYE